MTTEETRTVLTILKTTYPNFYKDMSKGEMQGMLEVWSELFTDDDVNLVKAALKQMILTSKFPPAIAEIKSAMFDLVNPNNLNEIEAFNLVKKACRSNSGDAKSEYAKLPIEIQKAIRTYETLQEWAVVNVDDMETIVFARFRDMFRQAKNELRLEFISTNQMLEMKDHLKIENGDEKDCL